MKKLWLFVLICALICTSYVFAEEPEQTEFVCAEYRYTLREDGTAEIIEYTGNVEELEVPEELDGKRVTGIGGRAFSNCYRLISVTLPDSVIEVGENPFWGCDDLTDIRVSPDSPALAVIDGVLFSKQDKRLVCYPSGAKKGSYDSMSENGNETLLASTKKILKNQKDFRPTCRMI